MNNRYSERLTCNGHLNIMALHQSTFEITKEEHLTPSGTCIIGVHADKGLCDFNPDFIESLASDTALLVTTLSAGKETCTITARGSSRMTLDHPTDIVWRRSSFIDNRTIGIHADFTAKTLPRELIAAIIEEEKMTVDMELFTVPEEEQSSAPQIQAFFHRFL